MSDQIGILTWEAVYTVRIREFLRQVGAADNDHNFARTAELMRQVMLDIGYMPPREIK